MDGPNSTSNARKFSSRCSQLPSRLSSVSSGSESDGNMREDDCSSILEPGIRHEAEGCRLGDVVLLEQRAAGARVIIRRPTRWFRLRGLEGRLFRDLRAELSELAGQICRSKDVLLVPATPFTGRLRGGMSMLRCFCPGRTFCTTNSYTWSGC